MRAWQDGDEVYVQRDGGPICHQYAETPIVLPSSAVELVPAPSVVDSIRAELRGLPGMTPAARRALRQVLDRAAGASS